MDKRDSPTKESPKARRPLPTPAPVPPQRPTTPISPAAFYGNPSQNPPPLPTRPAGLGSSSTTYQPAAAEKQPTHGSTSVTEFREPELVRDERIDDIDEDIPPLTSNFDGSGWDSNVDWATSPWKSTVTNHGWGENAIQRGPTPYPGQLKGNEGWNGNFDGMWMTEKKYEVDIDGRDEAEEAVWWDPFERAKHSRPGPGMLPPILADELHNPDHTLFSVNATPPDIQPPASSSSSEQPAMQGTLNASSPPPPGSVSSTSTSPTPASKVKAPPPTAEDVRTAVPHANSYYCPKENGWVILSWRGSSVVPPLAQSFLRSGHPYPLPDQERRRRTNSCLNHDNPFSTPPNRTHHFHKYPKAVDGLKFTPPIRRNEWEMSETKQKRRAAVVTQEINLDELKTKADEEEEEEEGVLLDLYMCCQCSVYIVASDTQPGVVPSGVWKAFIDEKMANPAVGSKPEHSVILGLETLLLTIENVLWKSENRALRVSRPGFKRKIGWTPVVEKVFECISFVRDPSGTENEDVLRPPLNDVVSPLGKHHRAKLLRAWVEIGAWTANFKKINENKIGREHSPHPTWVQLDNAREMIQNAIGAHHDQIPRGNIGEMMLEPMMAIQHSFQMLGLSVMSYSTGSNRPEELLTFAYLAQCRCDPAQTVQYYEAIFSIITTMEQMASCPPALQDLLLTEQTRGRFTSEELQTATAMLGFGHDNALRVEYDNEIEEEFIENAWKECVKRSWMEPSGGELQKNANASLRIIAESRGSTHLRELYEKGKNSLMMTPDRAYDVLEVPRDVDESMLITVYTMRLDEQPTQVERMQEAMSVIAEVRNSERLREFIRTSQDPGEVTAVIPAEWPRGLNQLGNTCYLNSLLQYFYTIKDLRETLIPLGTTDTKSIEDEKLSDDALTKHRVGGRLVTRKEVTRSKRFVNHLAELFRSLENSQTTAITPAVELAKLALVTSKDEEEEEVDHGGTDTSNDTDATLVEDGPSRFPVETHEAELPPPQSPSRSPGSILGKRTRRRMSEMDIDLPSPATDPPPTSRASSVPISQGESSKSPEVPTPGAVTEELADVEMKDVSQAKKTPPPLPPRKTPVRNDSVMMFGRQHDVAECMDNCMFQIETALLKFDDMSDPGDEEGANSIVKKLFYGKMRQRFVETSKGQPTIHAKEDLFAHLPVNVAEDGFDIYDGLGRYFDDMIDYEGQRVPIEISLLKLPPVLQVQLQRVQFNRELVQSWKCQAYVKFEETIYMDRFMDTADPEKRKKSKALQDELHTCRERIRLLNQGQDISYGTILDNTSKFLAARTNAIQSTDIEMDGDLPRLLAEEKEAVKNEIEELRNRIAQQKAALEDIWKDDKNVPYELTSVFIHRGHSPSFGHYFFYSRNLPSNPDEWFKYNDSDVSKIEKEEVLQDTTGSTANPYLLVFARKGSEVVDTVKRFDPETLAEIN
ncbi:ubiquitin-specific protease ubp2 [Marasmius crinis-equi]|uniref:ubiquitinyl hydrolase 1 n=1 Tax=Marasmius crinis-equi TaxID=585013 RepID=A0ABR3ERL6_9AGAR